MGIEDTNPPLGVVNVVGRVSKSRPGIGVESNAKPGIGEDAKPGIGEELVRPKLVLIKSK